MSKQGWALEWLAAVLLVGCATAVEEDTSTANGGNGLTSNGPTSDTMAANSTGGTSNSSSTSSTSSTAASTTSAQTSATSTTGDTGGQGGTTTGSGVGGGTGFGGTQTTADSSSGGIGGAGGTTTSDGGSGGAATAGTTGESATNSTGGTSATTTMTASSTTGSNSGHCLANWRDDPAADQCLSATQDDQRQCEDFLDCYVDNDCSPSTCSTGPTQDCHENALMAGSAGKSLASTVYNAICN